MTLLPIEEELARASPGESPGSRGGRKFRAAIRSYGKVRIRNLTKSLRKKLDRTSSMEKFSPRKIAVAREKFSASVPLRKYTVPK